MESKVNWKPFAAAVVIVAVIVFVFGKIHVVYGGGGGIHICSKYGWTLEATFVDMDDVNGQQRRLFHEKVFVALDRCLKD